MKAINSQTDLGIAKFILAGYFLFLPLKLFYSIVLLIVLIAYWIISGRFNFSFKRFKNDSILWIFISYYLIHVTGLLHTSNYNYALADLQTKFSFLIVPVVFAGIASKVIVCDVGFTVNI